MDRIKEIYESAPENVRIAIMYYLQQAKELFVVSARSDLDRSIFEGVSAEYLFQLESARDNYEATKIGDKFINILRKLLNGEKIEKNEY